MKPEDFDEEWVARFWDHVDKSGNHGGCWMWTTGKDKDGYGKTEYKKRSLRAHRVSFVLAGGSHTQGASLVLHSCHRPSCVNPAHLRAGSPAENMRDRDVSGRTSKGDAHYARTQPERMARGSRHGTAKLTEADVVAIRAAVGTQRQIARKFNVTQAIIWKVLNRKLWRHVA